MQLLDLRGLSTIVIVQGERMISNTMAGDATAFVAMFAPDWRGISNGTTYSRQQLRDIFETRKWTRDDISMLDVRVVSADAAVVTAISRSAGTDDGKQFAQTDHITDVFVRRDGKWTCVASHWSSSPATKYGSSPAGPAGRFENGQFRQP
jgi:uncharacterized protein (TIGR02246 family)